MAALIYDEVELFVVCLALGMVLAFVYDCVRIFRLFFNHKDWLVDVEDLAMITTKTIMEIPLLFCFLFFLLLFLLNFLTCFSLSPLNSHFNFCRKIFQHFSKKTVNAHKGKEKEKTE